MRLTKLRRVVCCAVLMLFVSHSFAQNDNTSDIKSTINKNATFIKQKWKQHRYFLYTAKGNVHSNLIGNQRSFLIDNVTGNCRLETPNLQSQEVIVLFNFKTKKLIKQYIAGKENSTNNQQMLSAALDQFFEDSKLLFLPILLTDQSISFTSPTSKIINTEKINSVSFSNLTTLDKQNVAGKIEINTKGEIKAFSDGTSEYVVQNYKDIGSGIILPTSYKNVKDSVQSCNFTTVAAFTDIEAGKFTSL